MRPILVAIALVGFCARAEDKAALAPPPDPVPPATATDAEDPSLVPDLPDQPPLPEQAPGADKDKSYLQDKGDFPKKGESSDTMGPKIAKPEPDVKEETPAFFAQVDKLLKAHDPISAIDYLKRIVINGDIRPQYRSRVIIQLADVLDQTGNSAEALCWLKVWSQMFPVRSEFAAVAYRTATLYTKMGMPDLAREAYYLALAHAVNQGQVHDDSELIPFQRLTNATLWGLAANEYQAGNWKRAADLFDRFRTQATNATPLSLEKAAFLQADCEYQMKDIDHSIALYEATLKDHPFNPLAPQARLRLYHMDMIRKQPAKASQELEALAWTVRTAWPKDEVYWQRETARLLLAINQKNCEVLPPLLKQTAQLPPEGKTWQDALNHYDALVSYQVVTTHAIKDSHADAFAKAGDASSLAEQNDLAAMYSRLDQILPPPTH